MVKEILKDIMIVAIFALMMIFVLQFYIDTHESIHEQICRQFGGDPEKKIEFMRGNVTCHNLSTEYMLEAKMTADTVNEIISYNILFLIGCLFLLVTVLALVLRSQNKPQPDQQY